MHVLRSSLVGSRSALERIATARNVRRILRGAATLAVVQVATLTACKETADPPRVVTIAGMNASDSVRLGKTHTFSTELRDAAGNRITGRSITWTSLKPTVAAVDASGLVTGVAVGAAGIIARVDDATATTLMFVQPAVTSVLLLPPTNSIPMGGSKTLTVAASDKDGQSVGGRLIAYSSSNPSVATVNASGTVVAITLGTATITAESVLDHVAGTATVSVVPVAVTNVSITPAGAQTVFQGLTMQLSATTRDGSGNILIGRPVNWTTSNQAVATVSGTGLVTGVSLGSAQITAESEGVTSAVQLSVAPRPIATISLTPNPGSVKQGSALQMSLDLRDANGSQLNTVGRTVTWESSNKPIATVSDGVVVGVSQGAATISATVDGRTASAVVTVTP
jgi:uncharacterized protein YjdB